MSLRTFIMGVSLFSAGLLLGWWWRPFQITPDDRHPLVEKAPHVPDRKGFSSIEEAIRLAPELVLEDLAKDPYLGLTESEIKALAEAVDLRNEHHRRLINLVTPPDFGQELWHAVMRANIGKMPLEEIHALTKDARSQNSSFGLPIAEAIHALPDRKEVLAAPWARGYLMIYFEQFAHQLPSLQEAFALIPPLEASTQIREELVTGWMRSRRTAADMNAVFQLTSTDRGRMESYRQNAAYFAWTNPGERPAVLDIVSKLSGQQRNWTLHSLASATPKDDPATMVNVLSQFTSFQHQQSAANRWLGKQDDEGKRNFLRQLEANKDHPALKKLRAELDP